ncbi:MAG: autotransporter-associated beta strand repeat-containing protein [Kiritimatiellae bacterium]|nr:autotransporter-associated beta strand repeat-containing protein [Kiritimatiellia bacterium]
MRRRIGLVALAAVLSLGAAARDVTGLTVADGTVSVTFEAGAEGDSHVLYYVWSNDGIDKGTDLFAWPNAFRVDRVADDATSCEFTLPASAFLTGQYACRALLATSAKPYDYLVEGVKSTKSANCFVSTGYKPVGGKTALAIDFALTAAAAQQYILGVNNTYSLCVYVNGSGDSGKWAFSSNDGTGSWSNPTTLESSTERTKITLDTTASADGVAASVLTVTTPSGSATRTSTESHTKTAKYCLALFGRATTNTTIDKQAGLTIYSCTITNAGTCVRNYRPCVSNGVAGLYDTVNGTFNPSSGSVALTAVGERIVGGAEDGDVVVGASPVWSQATPDYTTPLPFVEASSLTFANGGSKRGPAPLTLAGANNWGGTFTVCEGALLADFGMGLAATDNLVLDGGTYCPLGSETFTGAFGAEGGQLLVAADAEAAGFSAYGHPLTVRLWNDASKPLVVGSEAFGADMLVLNDDWADETLTFENDIVGETGKIVRVYSGKGTAVVTGCVTNEGNFAKYGSGTLVLKGTENVLSNLYPYAGALVIAPPDGAESCNLSLYTLSKTTNTVSTVVISNAVTTSGTGSILYDGNTTVKFVGGKMTSSGDWYPANRSGAARNGKGGIGTLILDGADVTTSGDFWPGYYGSVNNNALAETIVTNGATFKMKMLYGRYGNMRQYSGKVTVTSASGGGMRLGCNNSGTFNYYLHGGTLELSSSGGNATFSLGFHDSATTYPKGHLYVYAGGTFISRGAGGYIGRYQKDSGYLHVYGGSFSMTKSGATLRVGYLGNGVCEIIDGGNVTINGNVEVLPNSATYNGRTGTLSVLTNGTLKTRSAYSTCTNDTATLVLDGGTLVANTSAAEDFLYGFTAASVGVGGATLDTAGFNLKVSQNFDARDGQAWDAGVTAAALADAPAFTKTGAGTLALHGTNTYLCATCVSNGTLAVTCAQSLPATTTLRVATDAVVDLAEKSHTVANLMGSGLVTNGTLTVTGTVWPGYPDAGTLTVAGATLAPAKLAYVLGEDGACGQLAVGGALDLTGVEITVDNLANKGKGSLTLVTAGSITGTPTCNQPEAVICVDGKTVRLGSAGMTVIIR